MGKAKIDLGISTEEKPEWTISLDFDADHVVKDDLAAQSKEQEKTKGTRSIFNDALDSDFLTDDRSSFSNTQILGGDSTGLAGGLDETIQIPGTGSSSGNDRSSEVTEPVSEMINEPKEETPDRERDEVEEKLTHLVNSMDPWEQSENALSEVAAMLSKEGKISAAGADSEEKKLKDLFERLDISENLDRMNAVAQEDMADVIEQTQKDNELVDAIDVETADSADTVMKETEPEPVLDLEPQKEETISLGEIEITNDMFDMGYDLSDEEKNYSDENIDLNLFKGSIEDADEFSSTGNSLDLDEVEHTGQNVAELDMSNLVVAAMSGLGGSYEGENTEVPEPEESTLSEAEFVSEPEESESTLDFVMPEESTLSEAEFVSELEESESTLDVVMPEESTLSEAEFVSEPEESESTLDVVMPEETEEPEQIKLEFEPVYPEGQGPYLAGILEDPGDGDVASMIIEDYSEVPTVSDIETKLKKREKEKRKNKSKESQQKKTDGFAYSLDDINPKTADHIEQPEEKRLVGKEAVQAALEVAAETAAAAGGASKGAEFQSEEFTASVYARHVVYKEGKIKRSYYSLFYK